MNLKVTRFSTWISYRKSNDKCRDYEWWNEENMKQDCRGLHEVYNIYQLFGGSQENLRQDNLFPERDRTIHLIIIQEC
jgi:hypothetical protein